MLNGLMCSGQYNCQFLHAPVPTCTILLSRCGRWHALSLPSLLERHCYHRVGDVTQRRSCLTCTTLLSRCGWCHAVSLLSLQARHCYHGVGDVMQCCSHPYLHDIAITVWVMSCGVAPIPTCTTLLSPCGSCHSVSLPCLLTRHCYHGVGDVMQCRSRPYMHDICLEAVLHVLMKHSFHALQSVLKSIEVSSTFQLLLCLVK